MTQNFFQTFILLLLVTDPFGNVSLFVNALKRVPIERRWKVVVRECMIAFGILLLFMFFGRHFLNALQLSEVALRIGGGVILFLIAMRMVFPQPNAGNSDHEMGGEPFIVPLAIPALAGPSALATVLLFSSHEVERSHRPRGGLDGRGRRLAGRLPVRRTLAAGARSKGHDGVRAPDGLDPDGDGH